VDRWKAGLARRLLSLDRWASRLLHPLYRTLSRWGAVHRMMPARLRPRIVLFRVRGSSVPRLMLGGRLVGQYDMRSSQWIVRRPFRLLVEEKALEQAGRLARAARGTVSPRSLVTE
jgi:hypothetical protein